MTEILTESFCERCGTRYTFETVAPRQKRLGGLKVLGRGLKSFVLSDDTSLDEALAGARSDEEREMAGRQLDAFHKTFNFCMNCRQYTCANCWNPIEARCLSCAPRLDQVIGEPVLQLGPAPAGDVLPLDAPPFAMAVQAPDLELPTLDAVDILGRLEPAEHDHIHDELEHVHAEPEHVHDELEPEQVLAEPEPEQVLAEPEPEQVLAEPETAPAEVEPVLVESFDDAVAATNGVEPDLEGLLATPVAAFDGPAATPTFRFDDTGEEPVEATDLSPSEQLFESASHATEAAAAQAAEAAARTHDLLVRFRPGQSLDAEIEAYEAAMASEPQLLDVLEPEPEPEPVLAAESAVAQEPEPVAAEPEPAVAPEPEPEPVAAQPEPVAAEPEPVAAAEPEPEAPAAPQRDIVEQPAWPRPEAPAAAPGGEPEWPTGPRWPTAVPAHPTPPPTPPQPTVPPPFPTPAASNPTVADADPLGFLTARRAGEAMWAASAQDVVAAAPRTAENIPAGVRSCVSCGLSLSATARFCRRCGTRQGDG